MAIQTTGQAVQSVLKQDMLQAEVTQLPRHLNWMLIG